MHALINFPAAAAQGGAGCAQQAGVLFAQIADAAGALLHGIVVQHGAGQLAHAGFQFVQAAQHPADLVRGEVAAHAAHHIDGEDDAVAGRGFTDVHDVFTNAPELLEDAFKAKSIGKQAKPEQVRVHAVQF